jgi:hypothetical protein
MVVAPMMWATDGGRRADSSTRFPGVSSIIFLLTSTGQTGEPISMIDGSNDAIPTKEVPFRVSMKKIDFTGSVTPKSAKKWAWSMVCQPNSENQ